MNKAWTSQYKTSPDDHCTGPSDVSRLSIMSEAQHAILSEQTSEEQNPIFLNH